MLLLSKSGEARVTPYACCPKEKILTEMKSHWRNNLTFLVFIQSGPGYSYELELLNGGSTYVSCLVQTFGPDNSAFENDKNCVNVHKTINTN